MSVQWSNICAECGNMDSFLTEEKATRIAVVTGDNIFVKWKSDYELDQLVCEEPYECHKCGSGEIFEVDIDMLTNKNASKEDVLAMLHNSGMDEEDMVNVVNITRGAE